VYNIKTDTEEEYGSACTGLIWLRISQVAGCYEDGNVFFGFHKVRGIIWLAEELLASQAGLLWYRGYYELTFSDSILFANIT